MPCKDCGKQHELAVQGDAGRVSLKKTQGVRDTARFRVILLAVFDLMNTVFGPDSREVADFHAFFRSELGPTPQEEAP